MKILVTNIEWDTDNDDVDDLPSSVEFEVRGDFDPDAIADILSEQYGFCVFGCKWKKIK